MTAPSTIATRQTRSTRAAVSRRELVAAYVEATKPRIMVLLLVTCIAGMLAAQHGLPGIGLLVATAVGFGLSSGGASALNHVIDRDIDGLMARTARRPIVTGVISPRNGTIFGSGLLAAAGVLLWTVANPLTAVLSVSGGLFYVVGYTMLLKRTTVQNIVIGGAAGAVPPLVGWAAVRGDIGLVGLVLFLIVFLWTPPHFWALSLLIRDDYAAAGVPMLPVVKGNVETARQIWIYSWILVAATLIPVASGDFGLVYTFSALGLGARLLMRARALRRVVRTSPDDAGMPDGSIGRLAARSLFLYSMSYLGLLFVAVVLDQTIFSWHIS